MFIVIYRPHNVLSIDTQYIGPFDTWSEAYDCLCSLPGLGVHVEPDNGPCTSGYKFVPELTSPNTVREVV